MSTRDDVLARVRQALHGAGEPPAVPRAYRSAAQGVGDVVDLFVERVSEYGAVVVRCSAGEVEGRVADALDGAISAVPADLPWQVPGSVPDRGLSPADLDRLDAVVTGAAVGIAVTGTIVLDHGPGQGRRVLTLLPDLHVCVLRADQVRYGVPDAVAVLDPLRPQTWISGPSATSDIELSRVEGVHGPRRLRVVLVDPD